MHFQNDDTTTNVTSDTFSSNRSLGAATLDSPSAETMGNSLACFSPKIAAKSSGTASPPRSPPPAPSSSSSTAGRAASSLPGSASSRKNKKKMEAAAAAAAAETYSDALIREQAIAAVMLLKQYRSGSGGGGNDDGDSLRLFNRSTSTSALFPSVPGKGGVKQSVARSSTSRRRSCSDFPLPALPQILADEALEAVGVETSHFVLVHGGGYGAWCWYKTITLLRRGGFKVDAVDLMGSGIQSTDTNNINSMAEYVKPLIDIIDKLGDEEKVILVGHDFGGACVSYLMELYPHKIAKAVFLAAAMLKNGQSVLDMFSLQEGPSDLMRQAQIFLYGNGKDQPPTAIDLDKALLEDLLFNQSPAKDVALASVSMRAIPFAPILEKLTLSDANYGSVRRFYIETQEDYAIPASLQETMIKSNPPEKVFHLKGSDHSPFFSKPQALHRFLTEISKNS
ncbi:putative methylesterase 11, chloroplastic isoform X1 [Syzygium oleosum]|uniref:putative methylesterase 11, chloroplastic isoform X1 n=1 Tax=Syzygium oleosum TaxID=219896 RepID=UPI0011D1B0AF|nr:putative methylesterase 11, chloroplastic isoform X1 [Syzygium oleosum]